MAFLSPKKGNGPGLGDPAILHAKKQETGVQLHKTATKAKLTRDQLVYKDELIQKVNQIVNCMGKDAPLSRIQDFDAETSSRRVVNKLLEKFTDQQKEGSKKIDEYCLKVEKNAKDLKTCEA